MSKAKRTTVTQAASIQQSFRVEPQVAERLTRLAAYSQWLAARDAATGIRSFPHFEAAFGGPLTVELRRGDDGKFTLAAAGKPVRAKSNIRESGE